MKKRLKKIGANFLWLVLFGMFIVAFLFAIADLYTNPIEFLYGIWVFIKSFSVLVVFAILLAAVAMKMDT